MHRASYPSVAADNVGWLTKEQMAEVDRIMVEGLHIELIQMMENAGHNLARLILDLIDPRSVTVFAGSGGNGGGGLVAARHLANAGVDVGIALSSEMGDLRGVTAHQFEILQRMGVPFAQAVDAEVIVDALIGYTLLGPPRGRTLELIGEISSSDGHVISLDTPSGLDVTTGSTPGAVVNADATLTLALPKVGLRDAPEVGALYLADISVPPSVHERVGVGAHQFRDSSIVHVARSGSEPSSDPV